MGIRAAEELGEPTVLGKIAVLQTICLKEAINFGKHVSLQKASLQADLGLTLRKFVFRLIAVEFTFPVAKVWQPQIFY
jgi:hypothetical protein